MIKISIYFCLTGPDGTVYNLVLFFFRRPQEVGLFFQNQGLSTQAIRGTGEQATELKLVGASGFSGGQIGIGPVAAFGVQLLKQASGFRTVSVVVMIGHKACQVAQSRPGAAGKGTLASAIGTE